MMRIKYFLFLGRRSRIRTNSNINSCSLQTITEQSHDHDDQRILFYFRKIFQGFLQNKFKELIAKDKMYKIFFWFSIIVILFILGRLTLEYDTTKDFYNFVKEDLARVQHYEINNLLKFSKNLNDISKNSANSFKTLFEYFLYWSNKTKLEKKLMENIEELIDKKIYLYNADKTGMTDFASEAIGGRILFTNDTESYEEHSKWFTLYSVPITRILVSPRVVIQGSIESGNCWAFKGSKGALFIKLAAKITPKSFSLEHIPKELSLNGILDSAPKNFSVFVCYS